MKRTVYTSFATKERLMVETTGYYDCEGKAVWADKDGMVYELSYARLSKVWAACKLMSLEEGIKQGLYKTK